MPIWFRGAFAVNESNKQAWQALQTIVLIAAAAGVFMTVGKRDERLHYVSNQIDELRLVTQDLVRSQVITTTTSSVHALALEEVKERLDRLERGGD